MKTAGAKRPVLIAVVAILGLQVAPLIFEEKLIYFPYRAHDLTPADLGLAFDEVAIRAGDGVRLHGWFLPVPEARRTVLVCHGNAGNISHRLDRTLLLQAKLGLSVFLFDYRGYGKSEGSPNEEGTYSDGRAAYQYLIDRGLDPDEIVLFGESLGASIAVQLALEKPAAALVLEAPFSSIRDMAAAAYPFLPLGRLARTRYDNLAKIPSIDVPLLVFHGTHDRVVPFAQGERLFDAAPEPKRFYAISGAGHNDTFLVGGDGYWAAWKVFLSSL